MAEFILKALVRSRGQEGAWHIESAAVSTEEIGNPIYPPAKRCLSQHGVPFDKEKRARQETMELLDIVGLSDKISQYPAQLSGGQQQLTRADYDRFDRIICMDAWNLRLIKRIIPDDPDGKIHLMMSYTGVGRDVADPWYTGDFETTFQDILEGCEAMLM